MIIADENLHKQFVNDLLADGFTVQSVREIQVGMDDRDIAKWVLTQNALLITEDKDFGELAIFRGVPHFGIIRLVNFSATQHGSVSIRILNLYKQEVIQKAIITVDNNKVRVRLP